MARTLSFYQIFYKVDQLDKLYPFAIPYKNEELTDYFENSVIAEIVPVCNSDLISVCSWRLKQKRGDYALGLNGDMSLTEDKILSADYDIAVLTPRSNRHQPLLMAREWHGPVWGEAFDVFKDFLSSIGIKIKGELSKAIYENHFVAKKEIYHEYVNRCLNPAISFCEEREVFKLDSGYVRKKRDRLEVEEYQMKTNRKDWPIAPFILERLFSIWVEGKGFKIINL